MQKYNNNNIYFIESTNIKVFPCAYRGTKSGNIYDPEANVFTEYNGLDLTRLGANHLMMIHYSK